MGPGTGNLTSHILSKEPKKVYVIEKDRNLALKLLNNLKIKSKLLIKIFYL